MTEKTSIAIGVDQNGQVWDGHFGMSPHYYIYNRSGKLVEKRLNPYGAAANKQKHHHNPVLIVDLLSECGIFIARRMGDKNKQLIVEKMGVIPFITTEKDRTAALQACLNGLA